MSPVTNLLTDEAFHSTMVDPMKAPPKDGEEEPCDIWQYIEAIPDEDFAGFSIADCDVETVRRTGDHRFDHVLIPTKTKNVYLAVVVDLPSNSVFGHHLLNLNEKYGLETPGCG
jgi:hypothetical protein